MGSSVGTGPATTLAVLIPISRISAPANFCSRMPLSNRYARGQGNLIFCAARNPTSMSGARSTSPPTGGPCRARHRRLCMQEHPIIIKQDVFDHFSLPLHVDIRLCVKDDLADL